MTLVTWGLLFALMPKGNGPVIEMMEYMPSDSLESCMTQAQLKWHRYYQNEPSNLSIYTYCSEGKSGRQTRILDVQCDRDNHCEIHYKLNQVGDIL